MVHNDRILNQHNNELIKLLLPILEQLVDLIIKKPLSADLGSKMEHYVIQKKKTKEYEQLTF